MIDSLLIIKHCKTVEPPYHCHFWGIKFWLLRGLVDRLVHL